MKNQLLREWISLPCDSKIVKESREQNGGRLVLQGVLQRANHKNHNKRIYPRDLLMREMTNYDKAIRENRAMGQLDHPSDSTISLEKVSHIVKEAWWNGDEVLGKIEILPTPAGRIAESLIESGVTLGISSRGIGSTNSDLEGYDIVQPDYLLVAYDLVGEPSTHGAFMHVVENIERKHIFNKADRINRALNEFINRK